MHRLDTFDVDDLVACSEAVSACVAEVRRRDRGGSMEAVAVRIVSHLRAVVVDAEGRPAFALLRLYKSHRFDDLDDELRAAALASAAGEGVPDDTRCLTLLATAGSGPGWDDRRASVDHRAVPLVSEVVIERSPMIAGLLDQLGMDRSAVVAPDDGQRLVRHHLDYGVFHVPVALGSPLVPAQADFVVPYGIRSVVGCGGVLPSGDLFALVAFATTPVSERVADLFRSLAFSVKAALVPFTYAVFAEQ